MQMISAFNSVSNYHSNNFGNKFSNFLNYFEGLLEPRAPTLQCRSEQMKKEKKNKIEKFCIGTLVKLNKAKIN